MRLSEEEQLGFWKNGFGLFYGNYRSWGRWDLICKTLVIHMDLLYTNWLLSVTNLCKRRRHEQPSLDNLSFYLQNQTRSANRQAQAPPGQLERPEMGYCDIEFIPSFLINKADRPGKYDVKDEVYWSCLLQKCMSVVTTSLNIFPARESYLLY